MHTLRRYFNWPKMLSPSQESAHNHVVEAAELLPYYRWPQKSKKAGNNAKVARQEGLQSVWNFWLDQELRERGAFPQVLIRPDASGDNQKADAGFLLEDQTWFMVEVEFGNGSHVGSNAFKLVDSYNWGRTSICAIVCARSETIAITTGGSTTFEQMCANLERLHPRSFEVPTVVLGLSHKGAQTIDLSPPHSNVPDADMLSGNTDDKKRLWSIVQQLRDGIDPRHLELQLTPQEVRQAANELKGLKPTPQQNLF